MGRGIEIPKENEGLRAQRDNRDRNTGKRREEGWREVVWMWVSVCVCDRKCVSEAVVVVSACGL